MNKKIVFLLIFIVFILLCNNSFAFTEDFVPNLDIINEQCGTNFSSLYWDNVYNAISSRANLLDFYNHCNNLLVYVPLNSYYNSYDIIFYFLLTDYWGVNASEDTYTNFVSYDSSNYYAIRVDLKLNSDFSFRSINGTPSKVYYLDVQYHSTDLSVANKKIISSIPFYFNNNLFENDFIIYDTSFIGLEEGEEEGGQIDLSAILTEFGYIKAMLFLICMYLLCKTLYGVIWYLYNKTLL